LPAKKENKVNLFVKSTAILFLTLGLWVSNSWSQTEYEYVEEEVEEAPAGVPVAKAPRAPRPNLMADDYKLGLGVNLLGFDSWSIMYKLSPILKLELLLGYSSQENTTTPPTPIPASTTTTTDMNLGLMGHYLVPLGSLTGELGAGILYHSNSVDVGGTATDASDMTIVLNFGTEYYFSKQFSATGRLQIHYFMKSVENGVAPAVTTVDDTNIDTASMLMLNWYFL
jgi:hypothetical protein